VHEDQGKRQRSSRLGGPPGEENKRGEGALPKDKERINTRGEKTTKARGKRGSFSSKQTLWGGDYRGSAGVKTKTLEGKGDERGGSPVISYLSSRENESS